MRNTHVDDECILLECHESGDKLAFAELALGGGLELPGEKEDGSGAGVELEVTQ